MVETVIRDLTGQIIGNRRIVTKSPVSGRYLIRETDTDEVYWMEPEELEKPKAPPVVEPEAPFRLPPTVPEARALEFQTMPAGGGSRGVEGGEIYYSPTGESYFVPTGTPFRTGIPITSEADISGIRERLATIPRRPSGVPKAPEFNLPDILRNVYPEMGESPEEVFNAALTLARDDPEAFVEDLRAKGRNEYTESLLKALGADDQMIDDLYSQQVSIPQQAVVEIEGVRKLIIYDTATNRAYDSTGKWIGSYNPNKKEFTLKEQHKLISRGLYERLGYAPAPPVKSSEERKERVKAFQSYRKAGGKMFYDKWEAMGMPVSPEVEPPPISDEERQRIIDEEVRKHMNLLKVLGEGLTKVLPQVAAAFLSGIQGGQGAVDIGWADRFIEDAKKDLDQFAQETFDKYGETGLPFTVSDIAYLPQNIAYSLITMGAFATTAVPIGMVPLPGARVAAWFLGSAVSGVVAYQITTYQITKEYLDLKDEENMKETGRHLTLAERQQLYDDFESKARAYGLWEALPEAISNLAFARILTLPLGRVVGRSIATKILSKFVGIYGEEFLTETITQKGQSAIEVQAGLREGNITWVEAFKEVAPQTFLLTTVMGGLGQSGISTINRIKKSLKTEITETHPLYNEIVSELDKSQGLLDRIVEGAKGVRERVREAPERGAIEGVPKKPWQMINNEYMTNKVRQSNPAASESEIRRIVNTIPDRLRETEHKQLVQDALSEGKPVPAEVLAEYPDLVKGVPEGRPEVTREIKIIGEDKTLLDNIRPEISDFLKGMSDSTVYIVPRGMKGYGYVGRGMEDRPYDLYIGEKKGKQELNETILHEAIHQIESGRWNTPLAKQMREEWRSLNFEDKTPQELKELGFFDTLFMFRKSTADARKRGEFLSEMAEEYIVRPQELEKSAKPLYDFFNKYIKAVPEVTIENIAYHGTSSVHLEQIKREGLKPWRLTKQQLPKTLTEVGDYVYLSLNPETAKSFASEMTNRLKMSSEYRGATAEVVPIDISTLRLKNVENIRNSLQAREAMDLALKEGYDGISFGGTKEFPTQEVVVANYEKLKIGKPAIPKEVIPPVTEAVEAPPVKPAVEIPGVTPMTEVTPTGETISSSYIEAPTPTEGATARVFSRIQIEPAESNIREKIRRGWHKFNSKMVDDLFPLKRITDQLRKGGVDLSIQENPYLLARLLRGVTSKATTFLEYGTFGKQFWKMEKGKAVPNYTGESLENILNEVRAPVKWRDFSTYLTARRAFELAQRDIETGITQDDALSSVGELNAKYPEFDALAKRVYKYQDSLLVYANEMGLISGDLLGKLRQYGNYVPFYRVFNELESKGVFGKKMANIASPIKRIKGSEREIINPLESIVKNTYVLISAADRNQVGIALANLVDQNPELADVFERVKTPMARVAQVSAKELGVDIEGLSEAEEEQMVDIFRPSFFVSGDEVTVLIDGKKNYYRIDADLRDALLALNRESLGMIGKILGAPARWLRAGATLSPDFMFRNPARDQMTAFAYSNYGFMPGIDFIRGIASMIGKGNDYQLFRMSGAEHSMLVSMDRSYLRKSFKEIVEGRDFTEYVKHPLELFRIISELGEKATRLGEFKKGIQSGAVPLEAGYSARSVTLDFSQAGTTAQAINTLIAFFNATIRGWGKMISSFKEHPIRTSAKVFAGITLPSLLLWAVNHDDERWREIPQWQKDLFWIVFVGDTIYRIPKPFELGIIFGSVPERFLDWLVDKDPELMKDVAQTLIESGSPGFIPTAGLPILEWMTNYSFFRGSKIVPASREAMPAELQYTAWTSEVSKKLGELLKLPPAKIDNLIFAWTGGLGRYATDIMDGILKGTGVSPDIPEPSATLADTPVIKAFVVRNPYGSAGETVNDFYDILEKYESGEKYLKEMLLQDNIEKFNEFKASHPELLFFADFDIKEYQEAIEKGETPKEVFYSASARYLRRVARDLTEIRKKQDLIYQDEKMSPEEKRRLIDEMDFLKTDVARKALDLLLGADPQVLQNELNTAIGQLGEVIDEAPVLSVEESDIYDMPKLNQKFNTLLEGVTSEELKTMEGVHPLAFAYLEKEDIETTMEPMLNKQLRNFEVDLKEGYTFADYYKQWQLGLVKDSPLENLSPEQRVLLRKYHAADDETKKKLLEKHPELRENPRQEWIKSHPKENAMLALWKGTEIYSKEAYQEYKKLLSKFNVPEDAIPELTLPPETSINIHFQWLDYVADKKQGTWEADLLLLKDAEAAKIAGVQSYTEWRKEQGNPLTLSDIPIDILEEKIKFRPNDEVYNAIPDEINPETGINRRTEYLDKPENKAYKLFRRQSEFYSLDIDDVYNQTELRDEYVYYYNDLSASGYRRDRLLYDTRGNLTPFGELMRDVKGITITPFNEIPDVRYDELLEIEDRTQAEEWEMNAYKLFIGKEQYVDIYMGYKDIKEKGKPAGQTYWFDDDWYLMDNPEFYKEMVRIKAMTPKDFSKVPPRDVFKLYLMYDSIIATPGITKAEGRRDVRRRYPKLDAWLFLIGAVNETIEEYDVSAGLTPTERQARNIAEKEGLIADLQEETRRRLKAMQ